MAIRLKKAGWNDFTVLEQADQVGGTWRDNHYPGAACDVESHLYSFSFEPNPRWSRAFAPQKEILDYLVHCAEKYGVRPHIRFGARVVAASFDERAGQWKVELASGETLTARFLVSGCGGLSRPAYPDIPGLASFGGKMFHSARWDHSFDLAGKRVGVVGTGASAIQIVPAIAPRVGRLFVYQRTPPWIVPKPDRVFSPLERALFRRVPGLQRLSRNAIYCKREAMGLGFVVEPRIMKLAEKLARRHLHASVADPALRAKLTPSYTMGCKRVLPTNDWYPALQRPNVELVTERIREVTAQGVVTRDGVLRELDALVVATGFQAAEAVSPFPVSGRAGRELAAEWDTGAEAYLGTTVNGFPNLFFVVGPNTGLGHTSMILMIEAQIAYVMSILEATEKRGLASVEVKDHVQACYNERIHERLKGTVWSSGCVSWYTTRDGKNTTLWPGLTFEFRARTRRFRARDYNLQKVATAARPTPRLVVHSPSDAHAAGGSDPLRLRRRDGDVGAIGAGRPV
jgi:cation diffusion facilitator CzcD-associated flavoprotein CzcO